MLLLVDVIARILLTCASRNDKGCASRFLLFAKIKHLFGSLSF